MRQILGLGLALALSACASGAGYTALGTERANANYAKLVMHVGSGIGRPGQERPDQSNDLTIYLHLFNSDQFVGICGYYVVPPTLGNNELQIFEKLMANARLLAGEAPLAPASFMFRRSPQGDVYDAEATCIRTTTPVAQITASTVIHIVADPVRVDL